MAQGRRDDGAAPRRHRPGGHDHRTLIETHWTDLLRTAISIRENRLSSVTLLRRLGNHPRRNRLYRAFRELGRAVRTITLLRYLSDPDLLEQITQVTNRNTLARRR
ncbi:Tn3 family transposase [Bailinhaonella thermotolerans]|uniref:Tn3 family transposase n=1 Tax=Bailinhaonella thermotolerans TaxID=1070861 RepID=UPI003BEF2EAB